MDEHNRDGRLSYNPEERGRSMIARYNAIDPKNRGVIVADTCSLFSLAGKALQGKHYFDILTLLSEHGYKIMIPDMVAFEASQILPNGKNIGDYFRRNKGNRDHLGLTRFIKDIVDGKHPNMQIARTEEPGDIKDYIDGLVEITDSYPQGDRARSLIIDHQYKYHNRKNWGDYAIHELVKKLPSSPPVHVMTQDYRFLGDIAQSMPDLNVLTSFGLLLTVAESGLSKAIPFLDHSANANELLASCQRSLVEQGLSNWTSKTALDVSMKVALANPPLPHDCPMNISLIHTARSLGHDRPDQSQSIVAADILTEDEKESLRLRKLRREKAEKRQLLKGGIGDDSNGKGWIRL